VPALRTSRPDLRASLNDGARSGESRATGRMRSILVVTELALSLVLLIGAGLFTQSLTRLTSVELGYVPDNLLTLEYRLPRNKYRSAEQQWAFHAQVIERLGQVPGVQVASLAASAPQSGNGAYVGIWRSEDSRPGRDAMPRAQYNAVSDSFFNAMGIPLIAGRTCGPQDVSTDTLSVLVNQLMAGRMWPGESAVGKRLRAADFPGEVIVVGVVGNTRPQLLSQPIVMQIYACLRQNPGIFATAIMKTSVPPLSIARSVQQAIWSIDPDQPVWKVRSAETMVRDSVQYDRFVMLMMVLAAGLAMLLAVLGTYTLLSHTVQRRAREVGVRIALGATGGSIVRLMLRQAAALTASGLAIGLTAALALTRLIESQLYEVHARDPWTLTSAAATLGVAALLAAWLPTRRAVSADPTVTLRGAD
jgi:putative ABC transport system permease protein